MRSTVLSLPPQLVFLADTLAESMEQHVFAFSLIIEGTTEKVLQFMSIYNNNLGFIVQKMNI
jgi:hypothetical protein